MCFNLSAKLKQFSKFIVKFKAAIGVLSTIVDITNIVQYVTLDFKDVEKHSVSIIREIRL